MFTSVWKGIALAVPIVLAAVSPSQAVVVLRNDGTGFFDAYEVVTAAPQNWAGAKTASQIAFPGTTLLPGNATIGHLATITSASEQAFITGIASGQGDPWVGLTDKPGDAPGAFEGGNQTNFPVPAQGNTPVAGQRGYGWAWVTGEPLTYHNWNGNGEPNGNTGENHVQLTGSGTWNDLNESSVRSYIVEWDNVAPSSAANNFAAWKVNDIRNTATLPSNANYVNLARNPDGSPIITETYHQVINFGVNSGEFTGGEPFPQGGGDNFLTRGTAFIKIPTSGIYTISGAHDDPMFVEVGTTYGSAIVDEQNCCGSNPRQVYLTAGVYPIEAIQAEFGGGEHMEVAIGFGTLANGNPGLQLIGTPGHPAGVMISQNAASLGGLTPKDLAANTPIGWMVQVQSGANSPGFDNFVGGNNNNSLDNINEGVRLIQVGGSPEATANVATLNFPDNGFPAGTPEDQFALYAKGFADVLDPSGMTTAYFYVNSDDGFRLLVNGSTVAEFVGPTGGSNVISGPVSLKDNDLIELFMFEAGGGEFVLVQFDLDGNIITTGDRVFTNNALSGVIIRQSATLLPEPATALMGMMGLSILGLRRRRVA